MRIITDAQIDGIAVKINGFIDIPGLSEETEQEIFRGAVNVITLAIETAVKAYLPNSLVNFLTDAAHGIDSDKSYVWIDRLTNYVNAVVNIPLLSEEQEAALIRAVVTIVVKGMTKGSTLAGRLLD